jgi:hypothetical protein
MAQYNGNYTDEKGRVVEGADVFVYDRDGDLAEITDTNDVIATQPLRTDADGNFAYRAPDGFYQHVVWFGGRKVFKDNGVFIGDPNLSLAMASEQVAADAAQVQVDKAAVAADKAVVAADKALTIGYRNQAQGYRDQAQTFSVAAGAYMDGAIFDTEAEGVDPVTGVADTMPFLVPDDDGNLVLWRNVGGVATPIGDPQFISTSGAFLSTAVAGVESAAATVGLDTGNPASRGAIGGVDPDLSSQRRAVQAYSVPARGAVANQFLSTKRARMRRASIAWGHSAVAGSGVVNAGASVKPTGGIAGSLPRKLEFLLKQFNPEHSVANRGQSAQKSHEIAARMGAIPMNITLSSGTTLPVATVAACTTSPGVNGPSNQRNNAPDVYAGKIAGQACLLKAVDNTSTNPKQYTIEQVGGTGDIAIIPGTPFWLDPFDTDYGINILWATENDGDNLLSIDMIQAMVRKLPPDERRFIVMGDWPFATGSQDAGSTTHNNMLAKNAKMRELFGPDFFDVYKFLRGEYPYDGTVYASIWQLTGESSTQASNDWVTPGDWVTLGRIPRRWMSIHLGGSDVNHFHEDTNWWLGKALIEFHYRPKGWL